jgi:anthranilate synthase
MDATTRVFGLAIMQQYDYHTQANMQIFKSIEDIAYEKAILSYIKKIDNQRGLIFASSYEYPGRYTRWDIGFVNPPLVITTKANQFTIEALNQRGKIILEFILPVLQSQDLTQDLQNTDNKITGKIKRSTQYFSEELRSKQPSIFALIRLIRDLFFNKTEEYLGLYGAFGYDLVFQFETLQKKLSRKSEQRDLVLYLPDEILVVDHQLKQAKIHRYDFSMDHLTTCNLPREGEDTPYQITETPTQSCDHQPGEYSDLVRLAKEKFKCGDLFEVVPGQTFFEKCTETPSEIFLRLRERNPSPYGLFINLGEQEYLVGASPEMYVKVTDKRVETCPISGTIARGTDAITDAQQILTLLNSLKDESELTMCTDVDRNDKSRICIPGSVKVIGRRQIEMYSRVIHTVDHVEGILRDDYDAIDAFLSHMWVVTVTGAPKIWAMQFIEDHEKSPRRWYGGSIGWLLFNGNMNTGLTIRTIRMQSGVAEIRVGATLLFDSDPEAEELETRMKSAAFIDAIQRPSIKKADAQSKTSSNRKLSIILVDHQDSFVHTLANYLRQTGADVTTIRPEFLSQLLQEKSIDLVVLSPGPGEPKDFNLNDTIKIILKKNIPIFGVCLGLQGIVEYFGGELAILPYPMHGKPSTVKIYPSALFSNLPDNITVGRYHSLYAKNETVPHELKIIAQTDDGVIMAIEHRTLPIWAVQFHPESILSMNKNVGMQIIQNLVQIISATQ